MLAAAQPRPLSLGRTTLGPRRVKDETFYAAPAVGRVALYNEGEDGKGVDVGAWDGTAADFEPTAQGSVAALELAQALAAQRGMRLQFRLVKR